MVDFSCLIPWQGCLVAPAAIFRWRNPKCNGVLPPGSSGIPFIGETLELITNPIYSFGLHPFVKKRLQRYGSLFRTNVAGLNVVISADQEFNSFIIQQDGKLVMRWFLGSYAKHFKEYNSHTIHKYTKKLVLSHFGAGSIKQNLLSQFEERVRITFKSWSVQDSVEVKSAYIAMFGEFFAKQLFSYDPKRSSELTKLYIDISKSLSALPLNIPGTTYHKSLKDKKKVYDMLRDVVNAKLASPQDMQDDFLDQIIKDMSTTEFLTDEFITQLLFSLQLVTSESLPSILACCLKLLSENPDVLPDLVAEHDEILKNRKILDSPLTWEEYKSMTFTLSVINETMRLVNIVPGMLRRVIKDINLKGYTIPEGWIVMISNSALHLDPTIYNDPLKFDPYRWKDAKSEFTYKNFMPFGAGIKQCSGAEFSKAAMCTFLHVLVTKYRWSIVKGGEIIQNPTLRFKNALHIRLSERPN